MKLIHLESNPLTLTYELSHTSGDHTLTQKLFMSRADDVWHVEYSPYIPSDQDPEEAVKKLGEQLYRMSQAIMEEAGNFGKIDLTKISLT